MKIINEIDEFDASKLKRDADNRHKKFEQEQKHYCFWLNAIVCTMAFIGTFVFMITFSMITDYHKEWYSWIIAMFVATITTICIHICMDVHFTTSDLEITSYPSQYQYWFYKTNFKIIDFDMKNGVASTDRTIWLVVEDYETKEISRKYIGNFNIVERTDIKEDVVDLKENKYYVPYKKVTT